jgi:predicted nucleotidyltransferase
MTLREAVLATIAALDEADVAYMLVGSFSTNAYGVDRATKDIDLLIELGDASIREVARHLPESIRIDPRMGFKTVTMTRRYVARIEGTAFEIEFFLLSDDPHDQERFRRRVRAKDPSGRDVVIPTVEDVIITKLNWAKLAGRAKERRQGRAGRSGGGEANRPGLRSHMVRPPRHARAA